MKLIAILLGLVLLAISLVLGWFYVLSYLEDLKDSRWKKMFNAKFKNKYRVVERERVHTSYSPDGTEDYSVMGYYDVETKRRFTRWLYLGSYKTFEQAASKIEAEKAKETAEKTKIIHNI